MSSWQSKHNGECKTGSNTSKLSPGVFVTRNFTEKRNKHPLPIPQISQSYFNEVHRQRRNLSNCGTNNSICYFIPLQKPSDLLCSEKICYTFHAHLSEIPIDRSLSWANSRNIINMFWFDSQIQISWEPFSHMNLSFRVVKGYRCTGRNGLSPKTRRRRFYCATERVFLAESFNEKLVKFAEREKDFAMFIFPLGIRVLGIIISRAVSAGF